MAYIKTDWKARTGSLLSRFSKEQETDRSVVLHNQPGAVTQPGTPFSIDNMNKIEQGIFDAHQAIDSADNEPTLNSINLIKSGGVFRWFENVFTAIKELFDGKLGIGHNEDQNAHSSLFSGKLGTAHNTDGNAHSSLFSGKLGTAHNTDGSAHSSLFSGKLDNGHNTAAGVHSNIIGTVSGLTTNAKTIVSAINEVNAKQGGGVGTIGWGEWAGVPAIGNYIIAMGLVSNSIPPSFMLGTLVNICVAARPECCRNGAPLTQDYFIYDSNNRNYFYLGPQGGYVIVGTVPGTYRFLGRTNFDMGNYIYANNQTANLLQRVA